MWIQKQAEKHIENWIADDDFCEAFSVICFNTSTVASFEKAFVDPVIKLNNWLVWCETWNSVGNGLEIQSGLFLFSLRWSERC